MEPGLHYFYVGRIKGGLLHLIFGILFCVLLIDGIAEKQLAMIVSGIAFLVLINVVDLARLMLGTFKDNVGAYLRV